LRVQPAVAHIPRKVVLHILQLLALHFGFQIRALAARVEQETIEYGILNVHATPPYQLELWSSRAGPGPLHLWHSRRPPEVVLGPAEFSAAVTSFSIPDFRPLLYASELIAWFQAAAAPMLAVPVHRSEVLAVRVSQNRKEWIAKLS